ncbi:unnamed protein product [Caenorhabditis bovis]|uniref:RING-type domain-containing protein n=1 Tax=Caenorhabditis bovis TaxID=2654633 RepID=A0A8S1EMA9_9PELO|nr:unnamed protein product [Caenorhabditis bovis]
MHSGNLPDIIIRLVFALLMRFLQNGGVEATILPNWKADCNGQMLLGTLHGTAQGTYLSLGPDVDYCTSEPEMSGNKFYLCNDCVMKCPEKVVEAPESLLFIADVEPPNSRLKWFTIHTPVANLADFAQCQMLGNNTLAAPGTEETSTDALRSFSKTSVLFVSISFIILMVISLAWLVFYYVQRFRYAHAKDRLQRRLFNAARKALARIPTKSIRSGDEELQTDCAVCLDPYQLHDIVRTLPCRHAYHKSCIDPWLLEHRTCPMCKADILKYFGYQYYDPGRTEDLTGRVEIGDRERERVILPNEIVSPEGSSDSSDSNGFSFDHSEHVESFAFTPSVPPQLVLNAANAKTFRPMSSRVGSASSMTPTSSSSTSHVPPPTSYSARGARSGSHELSTSPQRLIRTSAGSSGSQGQIVNLVQVKSRAASVTRAATIRKESVPPYGPSSSQPTPIDVSSDRPSTSTSTQVV